MLDRTAIRYQLTLLSREISDLRAITAKHKPAPIYDEELLQLLSDLDNAADTLDAVLHELAKLVPPL